MPLQRWTGALEELWGLDPGSVRTYEDLHQRVHPEDRGALEAHWAAALAEGRPFEMEYRIVSGSGATRWIYSKGEPVYNEAGEPARLIGNNIDITERKRTDEALRAADRNKSEFIAMLAHELRNPLAPIRTAAEILSRAGGGSDPAQDQAVDVIGRQVRQMTRLVDDLLDVNRIAQGKIILQTEAVGLDQIVSETAETCRPLFDHAEVQLTVALPTAPVLVAADPARLAQIVHNLLSNAAKFTPRGGHVRLTVQADGGSAVIRVVDDGIGIAHEQIDRVFDRFFQVDTSLERATGGLGLGLTLVKTLVELHEGTVCASSAGKGLGTEFVVCLPLPAEPLTPLSAADRGTNRTSRATDPDRGRQPGLGGIAGPAARNGRPHDSRRARWPRCRGNGGARAARSRAARPGPAEIERLRCGAADSRAALRTVGGHRGGHRLGAGFGPAEDRGSRIRCPSGEAG